jgi:hypothetical protein
MIYVLGFSVLALLVAVSAMRSLIRERHAKVELALKFGPENRFVGKSLQEIIDSAGPYCMFGAMDHGQEVAQWRKGNLIAEVWLKGGKCVAIELFTRRS